MSRKIIGLSLAAIILLALTATGTWAFFRDTETGSGNSLAAGTLDLQVGNFDPMTEKIDFSGVKPGDAGDAAAWSIRNTGSISGHLSISAGAVNNDENVRSEVETASGDSTDNVGELGGMLTVALWMDSGTSGWSSGDYYLDPSGSGLAKVVWSGEPTLPAAAYFTLNTYSAKSSASLQTITSGTVPPNFRVNYNFPESGAGDNQSQSDSCNFDLIFTLSQ